MPKTYPSLVHLNGNVLAAIDFETTGKRAGFHEIIQVGIVPLNSDLRPLPNVTPFYWTMKPVHPDRWEGTAHYVHGLNINDLVLHAPSAGRVKDLLIEWFEKLDLPFEKKLIPLAHNWAFESAFGREWLGDDMDKIFSGPARDAMTYSSGLNDKAAFAGHAAPFNSTRLGSLCKKLQIHNARPHDALQDAYAEAELYRALLHIDLF